jgi:hypothetical protein
MVGNLVEGSPLSNKFSPGTSMISPLRRYLAEFPAADSTPLGDQENLYLSGLSAATREMI